MKKRDFILIGAVLVIFAILLLIGRGLRGRTPSNPTYNPNLATVEFVN